MARERGALNAREELEAAAMWLGYQDENLSFGLQSAEDGLKLWRYGNSNIHLAEMADTWEEGDRRLALGYDPLDGVTRSGK